MRPKRVVALICGTREYDADQDTGDPGIIESALRDAEIEPRLIIEGGAAGIDERAREYALNNGVPVLTMHANWTTEGKAAGPIRNERMRYLCTLLEAEGWKVCCVAIPGPKSKGTWDMVEKAEKAGFRVDVLGYLLERGG